MMSQVQTLSYCKIVGCPNCIGKLCKLEPVNGGYRIQFKHKGSLVLTVEAVIKCVHCGKCYLVNSEQGIVKEVRIARRYKNNE